MIQRVAQILRLEPDEARHALVLGAILFALTASYTLVKTARDAMFLARLPATLLPYVFLGIGVLTTIAAVGFARVTREKPAWRSFEVATWISALSLALFGWGEQFGSRRVLVGFYVWVNVYGLILISQFWLAANAMSNPHEAKRIFGFIGACAITGGLAAGLAAPPVVRWIGVPPLIAGAALLLVGVAVMLRAATWKPIPGVVQAQEAPVEEPKAPTPLRIRYVRWLALASLCSVLVTTLLDYQFKVEIQRRHDTRAEIAAFLGLFYTVTNLAALVIQVFLARWALGKLGAAWSASVLPLGLGIGAGAMIAATGFATTVSTRVWDQVLRISLNKSATELFFFPLTPDVRRRAKAWIEAGLERLGDALAGLVILAVAAVIGGGIRRDPSADTRILAMVVVVLVAIWMVAWLQLRGLYVRELGRNLRRMNLEPQTATVSLRESSVLGEVRKLLESPYERVVLHGIELLEDAAPEALRRHIEVLIAHPSVAVRLRALRLLDHHVSPGVRAKLDTLLRDREAVIRVAALRAHCMLDGRPTLDALAPYLECSDPALRRSALACVIEAATPEEEPRVRPLIEAKLQSGDVEDLTVIAGALGLRPGESEIHDLLGVLVKHESHEVRNAALRSAGLAGRRTLVPLMIDLLADRTARDAARAGLAAFGDRVVGTLGDYLADTSVDLVIRRELPRVLRDIATPEAAKALIRVHDRSDVRLAYRVLKAMNFIRSHQRHVEFPADRVNEDLEHDARAWMFAFVHYRSCPIGGSRTAERLLCIALNERMDQALNRIFRRLALVYRPDEVHAAYKGVLSEDPRARGNALEYVESALAPEHAELILPLIDDSGDEKRLELAETRNGYRYVNMKESLEALIEGEDPWLRTCALFAAGSQREHGLIPNVERQVSAREPFVRETALWARAALAAG